MNILTIFWRFCCVLSIFLSGSFLSIATTVQRLVKQRTTSKMYGWHYWQLATGGIELDVTKHLSNKCDVIYILVSSISMTRSAFNSRHRRATTTMADKSWINRQNCFSTSSRYWCSCCWYKCCCYCCCKSISILAKIRHFFSIGPPGSTHKQ